MIIKTVQGTWRVRVKYKGKDVVDKTFARKSDAQDFEATQKRHLARGDWINPKLGQETLDNICRRWLVIRKKTVAGKTYQTDEYMLRVHLSENLKRLPISSIRSSDIENLLIDVNSTIAQSSVVRFRAVLSALFAWAIREGIIRDNPAANAHLPSGRGTDAKAEIYPFSQEELFAVYEDVKKIHPKWADVVIVLGLSGLRWSELMALRVRDIQLVPYVAIQVSRSAPDGQEIRTTTKSGKPRTVPVADILQPILREWMKGKAPNALIFANAAGNPTGNKNWTRAVHWMELNRGRRIHDLRHTAATLWLTNGVDLKTVQTWLGHASMTMTVDLYAHFMGNDADIAAIARVNAVLGGDSGATGIKLRI